MYRDGSGFRVVNPLTEKKIRVPDEATARAIAEQFNELRCMEHKQTVERRYGKKTAADVVDMFLADEVPGKPWKNGTRANHVYKLKRFKRQFGEHEFARVDCVMLRDWLKSFVRSAGLWGKYRDTLSLMWAFAISVNLVGENEPLKVLAKYTGPKVAANRTQRRPLDVAAYKAIYEHAPAYLRLAMDLSLLTLQSRNEIINMEHTDFDDGYLFVIREKTAYKSNMAFIKIALTEELKYLRQRGRMLDNAASPYLVHRKPFKKYKRAPREGETAMPHWTWITPNFLSKAFKKARNKTGLWEGVPQVEQPGFHMIRKLGAQLAEDRGVPTGVIQALMTHSSPETTMIYLDRGEAALTASDFVPTATLFTLKEALGR
jgi:integrase